MDEITPGTRVDHRHYGKGTVVSVQTLFYTIDFGTRGIMDISRRQEDMLDVVSDEESASEGKTTFTMNELEATLRRVIESYSDISQEVELGSKWEGGKLILQPADASLKPKEIPVETFFHKITMLRDRLRVMEQKINANPKLSEEEKIDMQQYITRIYGSLTTFNVLFRDSADYFVGEKGKE